MFGKGVEVKYDTSLADFAIWLNEWYDKEVLKKPAKRVVKKAVKAGNVPRKAVKKAVKKVVGAYDKYAELIESVSVAKGFKLGEVRKIRKEIRGLIDNRQLRQNQPHGIPMSTVNYFIWGNTPQGHAYWKAIEARQIKGGI